MDYYLILREHSDSDSGWTQRYYGDKFDAQEALKDFCRRTGCTFDEVTSEDDKHLVCIAKGFRGYYPFFEVLGMIRTEKLF